MIKIESEHAMGLLVLILLISAIVGSYIKKLLRENRTKDIAIMGLREVIRLLEEKTK